MRCPTCSRFCDRKTRCECELWCLVPSLYKKPKASKETR